MCEYISGSHHLYVNYTIHLRYMIYLYLYPKPLSFCRLPAVHTNGFHPFYVTAMTTGGFGVAAAYKRSVLCTYHLQNRQNLASSSKSRKSNVMLKISMA